MTREREIEERLKNSTPGPWEANPSVSRENRRTQTSFAEGRWVIHRKGKVNQLPLIEIDHGDDHHEGTRKQSEFDAQLIAHAPDDLRYLLGEVRRLREENLGDSRSTAQGGHRAMSTPNEVEAAREKLREYIEQYRDFPCFMDDIDGQIDALIAAVQRTAEIRGAQRYVDEVVVPNIKAISAMFGLEDMRLLADCFEDGLDTDWVDAVRAGKDAAHKEPRDGE